MLPSQDAAWTVAHRIIDAVRNHLADIERSCVVPGQIAWDACDCGTLAVAITRQHLAEVFPSEPGSTSSASVRPPCVIPYRVVDLVVGVVRCAPNPGSSGVPSCDALDASAKQVAADAYLALTWTVCTLDQLIEVDDVDDYIIRDQPIIGPQGGCVGSELRLSISFVNTCPCD